MAFQESELVIALEMLGVSAGASIYRIDQLGLNAVKFAAVTGPLTAETAIRLTASTMTPERIVICQGIIANYLTLVDSTAGVSIGGGGVSSVPGLEIDFDKRLETCKQRLKMYFPFWDDWSLMNTRNKDSGVNSCSVLM